MAEELLEAVEKLQLRLAENQEPRKLLKTLKRLGELPITVDILVETGIGKTVNSLRKHEFAGEAAKNLVAKWKKLVPERSADRPTVKEGRSHSRINESGGHKRVRERSPEEPPLMEEEQHDELEYQPGYSPSPPQHYSSPYRHGSARGYQSDEYESPPEEEPELEPEPELELEPEPEPSPPRNDIRHNKPHKEPVREHNSQDIREQERRKHRPTGGGSSKERTHRAEREQQGGTSHKSKHDRHLGSHESKKEKKGGSDGKSRERAEVPEKMDEDEEPFEAPTMSFESFLTYDAPTPSKKKKKQPSRPPQPPASIPSASSKSGKANGTSSKRSKSSSSSVTTPAVPEKRRKVVDVVPTLPDIPLPAIQPNYRPLPSIDLTPLSPQRRKIPVSYDEEDAGCAGRRLNSKMVVYSGSKTAYLPKMMSLYDQCIRVLQNNIDSIDEVGGVPFEILEPVLERCTPEQLYRIEQCNQYFTEESDDLWMRHCQRDFKRDTPQEYESWREMYLRLHEEREERLRKLTMNISSAHANKPKGRQVKMAYVNSAAKPPRNILRLQEKFGTKNGSTSTSAAPPSARIRPATNYSAHSKSTEVGQSSFSSPPESSSRSSAPSTAGGHSAREKPQVKKIAPMMAKTIKAFKNRFSRR
ncbi:LOW QUALITY PROTEIN: elongin-A [Megalobrama amblycephala]|uniref:LOW QUALITY PROTEIN: elongin-A n=1 Tax=Megalobrama amblycephala TaxID=75352 RepID=UPI0020145E10|nr:LOW QUALITY PROTEIN: elongin-A [Megalobrama amblycephala]